MELPEHLQNMFDDNVRTARMILAQEGEIGPVLFMGGRHGNAYLPCDGFPSAGLLGQFLRFAIAEFGPDWALVVLDASMENQITHERGRNILWILETEEGGHWTAVAPVVTKGRKKTFGDVKLSLTKQAGGDLAGLFRPEGKPN